MDLVDIDKRVYPIGRLDKDSRGLVILTDDGELTNQITHPRFGCQKEYEVVIDKKLKSSDVKKLQSGLTIDGKKLQPVKITKANDLTVGLVLTEGINRQIRRMLGRLGYRVADLKRIKVGNLTLGKLKEGNWKYVKK